MIRSMTGYGCGACAKFNRKLNVEIKSVNHRYSDISIKIPRILNAYEDDLKKLLSIHVVRGKVELYVKMETSSRDDIRIGINESIADAYSSQLKLLKERYQTKDDVTLQLIAHFPDVITIEKGISNKKAAGELWSVLKEATEIAISNFVSMREVEGELIKKDLLKKNEIIKRFLGKIKNNAGDIVKAYYNKIYAKMKEILSDVNIDESRILLEAAIYADKICIDEELIRMESHIEQFANILLEGGAQGKKLDFLIQEMNREINTIGAKSNDLDITKIIVNIKSELEKMREQVQNIE